MGKAVLSHRQLLNKRVFNMKMKVRKSEYPVWEINAEEEVGRHARLCAFLGYLSAVRPNGFFNKIETIEDHKGTVVVEWSTMPCKGEIADIKKLGKVSLYRNREITLKIICLSRLLDS